MNERGTASSSPIRLAVLAGLGGIAIALSPLQSPVAYGQAAAGYTFTTLDSFDWTNLPGEQGGYSFSLNVVGGNLYGATQANNPSNNSNGSIFEASTTPNAGINTIYSFTNGVSDGSQPTCSLLQVGTTLYGTVALGGLSNLNQQNGTQYAPGGVFSINTNGAQPETAHLLASVAESYVNLGNGRVQVPGQAYPNNGLTRVGANLYGADGNSQSTPGFMTVPMSANGTGFTTTLFSFTGGGGNYPGSYINNAGATSIAGGFTLGPDGKTIYGAMPGGGPSGDGLIFAVTLGSTEPSYANALTKAFPAGATGSNVVGWYTDLYNFTGGTGGNSPGSSLVLSGNVLYGMTTVGGTTASDYGGYGNVFSYNVSAGTYASLHSFNGTDGAFPTGNLILSGTTLYGMTNGGNWWGETCAQPKRQRFLHRRRRQQL